MPRGLGSPAGWDGQTPIVGIRHVPQEMPRSPETRRAGTRGPAASEAGGKVWGRKDRAWGRQELPELGPREAETAGPSPRGPPALAPPTAPTERGAPGTVPWGRGRQDGFPGPRGCSQLGGNPQDPGRDLPSSAVPAGGGDPRGRPRPGASIHPDASIDPGVLRAAPLYPSVHCAAGPPSPSCLGRAGCRGAPDPNLPRVLPVLPVFPTLPSLFALLTLLTLPP